MSNRGSLHLALQNGIVALPALIFWLLNYPFMLTVYQEPIILQWAKVFTVIPLTINSHDNSDEDYRPGPQDE
jgi:DMSO reductase anchor subunit